MICVYLFYFSFILVLYLHFVRNKRNNNNNHPEKFGQMHLIDIHVTISTGELNATCATLWTLVIT